MQNRLEAFAGLRIDKDTLGEPSTIEATVFANLWSEDCEDFRSRRFARLGQGVGDGISIDDRYTEISE